MSKRVKLTAGAALLLVVGLVLAFTFYGGNNPGGTKPEKVRMGSFSVAIDYGPYLIAKEKGWFEEALKNDGIGVEYTTFQSLPPINESFATGRLDVVFEAEPPAIIGRAAGVDLHVMDISCSLTQEIIVPKASEAKSIKDLKGKKVAVLAGTSSHYGLIKSAQDNGLVKSDFQIIDMRPPDAKAAFETGNVNAWAVWPPWVEQELVAGTARVLPGSNAQIHSIMAVRGEFADKNPQVLGKIDEVLNKTKKWMQQNPADAQKVVSKALDLPLEAVNLAWPKHDWAAKLTPEVVGDIQAKADFLKEENLIKTSVNVARDLIKPMQVSQQAALVGKP